MRFLVSFLATGLLVLLGMIGAAVLYGIAFLAGLPFDLARFLVALGLGSFAVPIPFLWALHEREDFAHIVFSCLFYWLGILLTLAALLR